MPLIRDGRLVDDTWLKAETEDELAQAGDLIVTLDLWQRARARLQGRNGRLGIALASDQLADSIAPDLARFDLVALAFPRFTDGRAYSTARLLRERHGFAGELRATGNVLSDQLWFMLRCGFDAFEVQDARILERWSEVLDRFTAPYQPTANGATSIAMRRRQLATTFSRASTSAALRQQETCAGYWAY